MRNTSLTPRAKGMRRELTEAERRMWHQLRADRFQDIKFRRQKVIRNYIADFAANEPKLVVELDGDSHAGQEEYDAKRTALLEQEGYCVVRFYNSGVMGNMDGVMVRLTEVVEGLRACSPLPTLSPEGERAKNSATGSLSTSGKRVAERGKQT